jgi:pimeloyl-ACP methyl ester carboxylesterase
MMTARGKFDGTRRMFNAALHTLLAGALSACNDGPAGVPNAPEQPAATAEAVVDGSFETGGLYRLYRPANWNGRLVVYAHGTVPLSAPVALPAEGPLVIALLGTDSVAVAFSSWSKNGWALREGVESTHQLKDVFTARIGRPTHTYLLGSSQGGLVATMIAEKFPAQYDGALTLCSPNGGATRQFDYIAHVRALFDYFYPGVLPGKADSLPLLSNVDQEVIAPAVAAMALSPTGAAAIQAIAQTPVPGTGASEIGTAVARALQYHATLLNDVYAQTQGQKLFDNTQTVYTGSLPGFTLSQVNAGVGRFRGSVVGREFTRAYYDPNGDLRIPLLSMYNSRDPDVPKFNHDSYRAAVAAAGRQLFLAEREHAGFGHCAFSAQQLLSAFRDLVAWTETGVRPPP